MIKPIQTKYIYFFIGFFVFTALEPIALLGKAETFYMAEPLIRYFTICLAFMVLGLWIVSKWFSNLFALTVSALFSLMIISLRASFHPGFSGLSIPVFSLVSGVLFFIIFMIIRRLISSNLVPGFKAYACLAVIGLSGPAVAMFESSSIFERPHETLGTGSQISLSFQQKPNIYLLSYDSMIPQSIADEYLDIRDLPYQKVVNARFTEFPNALTFRVPTTPSISNVTRLAQKQHKLNYRAFSGNAPSLLSNLLKENNYAFITGYSTLKFGTPGPYIDKSLSPKSPEIGKSGLCLERKKLERIQALGACHVSEYLAKNKMNSLSIAIFGSKKNNVSYNPRDWHEIILAQIKANKKSQKPTLTYVYTYNPIGHTSKIYDHSDEAQRQDYKSGFLKRANILSERLINITNHIDEFDPHSILIIFGDHGTYVSRNVSFEDNPEFFVKDRYRVLIALGRTQNQCSDPQNLDLSTEYHTQYHTPSRLLLAIFGCLSGEKRRAIGNETLKEKLRDKKMGAESTMSGSIM